MGLFFLSNDFRDSVESCREYAERPEHWHHLDVPDAPNPKHDSRHTLQSGDIVCTYSWICRAGQKSRHLLVSSKKAPEKIPPAIVWTVAHLFGFTGGGPENEQGFVHEPGANWEYGPAGDTIVINQVVDDNEAPPGTPLH